MVRAILSAGRRFQNSGMSFCVLQKSFAVILAVESETAVADDFVFNTRSVKYDDDQMYKVRF